MTTSGSVRDHFRGTGRVKPLLLVSGVPLLALSLAVPGLAQTPTSGAVTFGGQAAPLWADAGVLFQDVDGPQESGAPQPTTPLEFPSETESSPDGIQWKPLLLQSAHALAWQHSFRLIHESRTRDRIASVPPLRNWVNSLRSLDNWDDGGKVFTNYVAHPMMGAVAGSLLINNDPKGRVLRQGEPGYWPSRLKALAYGAAYSAQFEVGPLSEASLGLNPEQQGWVDFVITPVLGFGLLLAEDTIDEHLIRRIEGSGSGVWTRVARMFLTPSRSLSNVVALKPPWYRADRALAP